MKHLERNEIRKRETDSATYYVIGEKVRQDLLTITAELKEVVALNQLPANWNSNDNDALDTMDHWLEDDRDFNTRQLSKFFKMFAKFGLPDNFGTLGENLGWIFGKKLTKSEMYNIMQERRDIIQQDKVEADATTQLKAYTLRTTFANLFDE